MREAVILSSKIEFNVFKPKRPMQEGDVNFLVHMAMHIGEANRLDLEAEEDYAEAMGSAAVLARMAGMDAPTALIDSSITESSALQRLDALRGQPAAWSSLVLQLWMLKSGVEDADFKTKLEEIQNRGEDEYLRS